MIWLRSALFMLGLGVLTPLFALLMLVLFPLGHAAAYAGARLWARLVLGWLRLTCGVDYRVVGTENIPDAPTIVMSKHQSAWETIFFMACFPHQVWVLKRELLRVPFFGWGLAMLRPIAIDRSAGREALTLVEAEGRDRLARGLWVVVFPEGTRVAPGEARPYHVGGAWLATRTGTPVLPVAHNAGELWGRKAFLKYPGTVTVSIGPAIDPAGLKPKELNARVQDWIENEMQRLNGRARRGS